MTVCPIALAVGCKRCPVFKVCPLKEVLGDQKKDQQSIEPSMQSAEDSDRQNNESKH